MQTLFRYYSTDVGWDHGKLLSSGIDLDYQQCCYGLGSANFGRFRSVFFIKTAVSVLFFAVVLENGLYRQYFLIYYLGNDYYMLYYVISLFMFRSTT